MNRASLTAGFLVAIAILADVATAQSRSDFSGVWKPVDNSSSTSEPLPPQTPGGPPPPPRTVSTTIVQSAMEMKMDRRVESNGREVVQTFVYKLDGTESVNQIGPILFRSKATWDGAALVLASIVFVDEKRLGEVADVYRLERGDLIVETTRQTPAGTFKGRAVNRKD